MRVRKVGETQIWMWSMSREGREGEGRGGDSISHIQTLVSFLSSLSFYYSWTSQKWQCKMLNLEGRLFHLESFQFQCCFEKLGTEERWSQMEVWLCDQIFTPYDFRVTVSWRIPQKIKNDMFRFQIICFTLKFQMYSSLKICKTSKLEDWWRYTFETILQYFYSSCSSLFVVLQATPLRKY